jgi:hypothetical protein
MKRSAPRGVWQNRVAHLHWHNRGPRALLEREKNKNKTGDDRDTRQNEPYEVKHGRVYRTRKSGDDDPGSVATKVKDSTRAYFGPPWSRANGTSLPDATTRVTSPGRARETVRHPCDQGFTRQYAVQRSTFLTGSSATASVVRSQCQYRSKEAPKKARANRYRHTNKAHRVACRRRRA